MKTSLPRLLAFCTLASLIAIPSAFAQRSLGKKKGPTSKLYMAEAKGESQIQNGDKIYTARQATAFDAPGTVIETKAGAHNALVYSNGTGMFVDENTRVEIDRFVQEPFQPERNKKLDTPFEPSVSQSSVHVSQGAVGICTSQLVSGSSMLYSTPHAAVNIRGGKVSIETNGDATFIDLLDGDVTVRGGGRDVGGQILRPGERATITPSATGGQPTISVGPIPQNAVAVADERTATACNAKKTVTFEVIEKKAEEGLDAAPEEEVVAATTETKQDEEKKDGEGEKTAEADPQNTSDTTNEAAGAEADQEIVARPTVPQDPPTNIVISPSALPGTTGK
jgi:hypothetical protein